MEKYASAMHKILPAAIKKGVARLRSGQYFKREIVKNLVSRAGSVLIVEFSPHKDTNWKF